MRIWRLELADSAGWPLVALFARCQRWMKPPRRSDWNRSSVTSVCAVKTKDNSFAAFMCLFQTQLNVTRAGLMGKRGANGMKRFESQRMTEPRNMYAS